MDEPKTIARYRLTGELGRGGMGVVYKAEDPQLGRPVAVKVILFPAQATDEFRAQLEKRFEREARSAASIHHPGVVTVHDFGRDGDYLFLVMELVVGESLADRLKTGWLPERADAFEIVAKVADGLAAAHAAGVVHRDVTPRNILMARDGSSPGGGPTGRIVVTDFGIARSVGEETYELTRTGMLVGSPSFMAPEQVRSKEFDARADIFSLGVVLYLLLTGKLPFSSQDLTSLLYQIVHEDPFESSEIQGRLGLGTVQFLKKCLAKEPADRVQTADEFAREARRLRSAVNTAELEETVALSELARERTGTRASGRSSRLVLALVLLVASVAAIKAVTSAFTNRSGARPDQEIARTPETELSTPSAAAVEQELEAKNPAVEAPGVQEIEPVPVQPTSPTEDPATEPMETERTATARETRATTPAPPPPEVAPPTPSPERESRESDPPSSPATSDPPTALESASTIETSPETRDGAEAQTADRDPADTVAPILDIDSQPQELTATEVVLSGRVMDDSKQVALTVDGDSIPIDAEGAFVVRRSLAPGRNALAFVATDPAGNQTMKSIEVSAPTDATASSSPAGAGQARTAQGSQQPPAGVAPAGMRQRFADRGDGTLFDTLTRITWTKRAEDSSGYKASKAYCKKLELGRHRDWSLPSIGELEELFLSGASAGGLVWSSTKKGLGKAWVFDFVQGQRADQPVEGVEGVEIKALCLRRPRSLESVQNRQSPTGPAGGPNGGAQGQPPPGGGQPPPGGGPGGGGGRGGGGG